MGAELMGQQMIFETYQKDNAMFAMKMGNGEMVFQEQKYDGTKGVVQAMGQTQPIPEGPELDNLRTSARLVPQRYYAEDGIQLELKGIEAIEGKECYKIAVTNQAGKATSEYYSVDQSLLIRSVATQQGPQGAVSIVTDYEDYQDIGGGIMIPFSNKITGMAPVPVEMKVQEVKLDEPIDASYSVYWLDRLNDHFLCYDQAMF